MNNEQAVEAITSSARMTAEGLLAFWDCAEEDRVDYATRVIGGKLSAGRCAGLISNLADATQEST